MSGSGNISPQSTTRMRPSTSMQKQLRPISPSPPRKTSRTSSLTGLMLLIAPARQTVGGHTRALCAGGFAVLRDRVERGVLLAGVCPVLELDHAQLGEPLTQPAVAGVEQAELLAVGHDLREQHRLEHLAVRRLHHEVDGVLYVDTEVLEHLLLEEPVTHAHGGLERELLALTDLRATQLLVVLLQREHAERDVPGLVAHHVAEELLQERLGRHLLDEPEGGEREALDHDLHAEVGHVPPRVLA